MSEQASRPAVDSVVQSVLDKFITRSTLGRAKYGTDLDRTDLSVQEWIQHAQEEHMDAILYLEKLKRVVSISPSLPSSLPSASFSHLTLTHYDPPPLPEH